MSSNIDQDFVEYIVKSLVSKPDAVSLDRRVDEKGVLLELTVDPEDLGRIIGKRGATAQSLRTLLRALGTKNDARYNLKIVDNGPEDYQRPPRREDSAHGSAPADDSTASDDTSSSDDSSTDDSSNDDTSSDDGSESATEIVEEVAEEAATEDDNYSNDEPSDIAKKTRRELEDLDDLDI